MMPLSERVTAAQRSLTAIYRLELDLDAADFVVEPECAKALLPPGSPRTGLVVIDEGGEARVGLYIDPADADDPGAVLEETSHLVYLAWQGARGNCGSRLEREIQAEVDRYAVARVAGADALAHFSGFRCADGLGPRERQRYHTAHATALRTCRDLDRRFPQRADTPGLLIALRRYYRAAPEVKLRPAA